MQSSRRKLLHVSPGRASQFLMRLRASAAAAAHRQMTPGGGRADADPEQDAAGEAAGSIGPSGTLC